MILHGSNFPLQQRTDTTLAVIISKGTDVLDMPEPLPHLLADRATLKRFAQIELVVSDIDGTLWRKDLHHKLRELSRALPLAPALFTVATARNYFSAQPILADLELNPHVPLILFNGAVLMESGTLKTIRRQTIPNATLRLAIEIATRHQVPLGAFFHDADSREEVLGWNYASLEEFRRRVPSALCGIAGEQITWMAANDFSDKRDPAAIIIDLLASNVDIEALRTEVAALPGIDITTSGLAWIELLPKAQHKGVALCFAAKHLGLEPDQVLAIGDNDNDIDMLRMAGIGVAVKGASSRAIAASDYTCRFGPFRGVVEVLRLIRNAKRGAAARLQPAGS